MNKKEDKNVSKPQAPKAPEAAEFSTTKSGEQEKKQLTLFDMADNKPTRQPRRAPRKGARRPHKDEPATKLMKIVAEKSMDMKKMKKTFSEQEMGEIIRKALPGEDETKAEQRKRYIALKRRALEMEAGNKSKLILFPSITDSDVAWYKVVEFSALYYVYRLAPRMGRSARLMRDSDRAAKTDYIASITQIEKFIEQFEELEGGEVEFATNGMILFTLKQEMSDDEVASLKQVERTKRERAHNLIRPKAMDPALYQIILTVIRQVAPKVEKMHMQYYKTTGEQMMRDIESLMATYFHYTQGFYDKETAARELMMAVNRIMAALALLAETQTWSSDKIVAVGENINEIQRRVVQHFQLTIGE